MSVEVIMYLVKDFPPLVAAGQDRESCPLRSVVVCPGPVVVDVAVNDAGAAGTVVNNTEDEGSEGTDCPFAFVATTVATPVTFCGIPIIVIGEDAPTSENVPFTPQFIVTV